jgi:chemotaxis protein methyltransferase WspC
LLPPVRDRVRFRIANLTDPHFLAGEREYDLIVCRNLFIYLTVDGRKRAMENLDRLLARNGWLCLAPGEADRLPHDRYVGEGPPEHGIYRRIGPEEHAARHDPFPSSSERPTTRIAPPGPREVPVPPVASVPPATPAPTPPESPLAAARRLADAGRLPEALAACEVAIRVGPTPEGYTLQGVLHLAEGRIDAAAEAFRKALYLDPGHVEAIAQMIVLSDRKGDPTQSSILRRRLARIAGEDAT